MESPTARAKEATAKTNAWATFTKQFPNANKTQFGAQISIDEKRSITAEMFFFQCREMKAALGFAGMEGFPY